MARTKTNTKNNTKTHRTTRGNIHLEKTCPSKVIVYLKVRAYPHKINIYAVSSTIVRMLSWRKLLISLNLMYNYKYAATDVVVDGNLHIGSVFALITRH